MSCWICIVVGFILGVGVGIILASYFPNRWAKIVKESKEEMDEKYRELIAKLEELIGGRDA